MESGGETRRGRGYRRCVSSMTMDEVVLRKVDFVFVAMMTRSMWMAHRRMMGYVSVSHGQREYNDRMSSNMITTSSPRQRERVCPPRRSGEMTPIRFNG